MTVRHARRVTDQDAEIGRRLRSERQAKGLSQQALAAKLGVSFQQVQKYEKGMNRLSGARVLAVAQTLNIAAAELLGAASPESPDEALVKRMLTTKEGVAIARILIGMPAKDRKSLLDLAQRLESTSETNVAIPTASRASEAKRVARLLSQSVAGRRRK